MPVMRNPESTKKRLTPRKPGAVRVMRRATAGVLGRPTAAEGRMPW
jgi:hypothetical protein